MKIFAKFIIVLFYLFISYPVFSTVPVHDSISYITLGKQ
ncbi:MAG: hypothetical protein LEGION0398_MBIBDBAK_01219 [Legionellaceae bacterium]